MVWQPDLFVDAGLRTFEAAAARLKAAVTAGPGAGPLAIRLDALDLCSVGDCATCPAPDHDPSRLLESPRPAVIEASHLRFWLLAAASLQGTRAAPYLIVRADQPPPPDTPWPVNLQVLLADDPAAPTALAQRAEIGRQWQAAGVAARHLITDGYGEFWNLPVAAELLAEPLAALRPAAVVDRDGAQLARLGPDWLAERQRAVLAGATSPAGDSWRADQPTAARVLDVFEPLAPRLVDDRGLALAAATVEVLRRAAAWDADEAQAGPLLAAIAAARALGAPSPPDGPLSAAFERLVAAGGPAPRVTVPRVEGLDLKEMVGAGAWQQAARLSLTLDDAGQSAVAPARVWLARDAAGDLWLAVEATEVGEANLNDRLAVSLAPLEGGGVTRVYATLAGSLTVPGAECRVAYGEPGWFLKLRLPAAILPAGPSCRLQVAVEHRHGRLRQAALWRPTAGLGWHPRRYGVVAWGQ
jgi:hypothetical protein